MSYSRNLTEKLFWLIPNDIVKHLVQIDYDRDCTSENYVVCPYGKADDCAETGVVRTPVSAQSSTLE